MRAIRTLVLLVTLAAVLAVDAAAFGVVQEPLPTGVVGQAYSYQFKVNGGNPPYTYTVSSGGLPPGLTLGSSGLLTGTPTQSGSWSFYIEASYQFGGSPPVYSQRQFTLNVIIGLAVQNTSLPNGTRGVAYSAQLTASGGGTQTWSVTAGALPTGLALASSGAITGVPTTIGTSSFTAKVTDGTRTATKALTISVFEPLVASAPAQPPAVVGSEFTLALQASGGTQPYTWAIKEGAWPKGLTFVNGVIGGKPRIAGSYALVASVTDAGGTTTLLPLTIVVKPRLKIPVQTLDAAVLGRVYREKIVTKGGASPLAFELDFGGLPPGLKLNAKTGAIVGKPKLKGRYGFVVVVVDQLGNTHRRAFVIRVR